MGGWIAVGVSAALLGVVLVRDLGFNILNGWTMVAGTVGGLIAVARRQPSALGVAFGLVLLATLPALYGGLGLLYLPALVLIFPVQGQSLRTTVTTLP